MPVKVGKKVSYEKDNALIKLIDKYEKRLFLYMDGKIPVASEEELLQLVLIGQIWKILKDRK